MNDTFEAGRTIGAYRIIRPLGSGGMGEVYEVEHLKLRTHRALKVFAVGGENAELYRRRFLSEGKVLAVLDHPRVVRVHEFDVDAESGRPYFVMDLVLSPDGTPRTLADAGAVGEGETRAAAFFRDVCEGLDYVHSLGIVHRDIKLENILIGPDGRAVLSDFGISRIFDEELRRKLDITLTMPQDEAVVRRLGSTFYLAPEQQGETPDKATPASDAWALGVMMFRYLTGFWFERANREKCLALLTDCELDWRPLIARLCAEAPEERIAEGGFASHADALVKNRGASVSAVSKKHRALVWVAALAVVAVGVAFAWLRTDRGVLASKPKADQPVLRISANFDDLKLLNGGNDVVIPGVSSDMRYLSLSWTEATIAKVLATGVHGAEAIARMIVNGEKWQSEVRAGITIDFPQGVDRMFLRGSDAGDSFSRALDIANLSSLALCAKPDEGFGSNSTCFVEMELCYKSATQVDEAERRVNKLIDEVKSFKHFSTARARGHHWLTVTTSFDVNEMDEVIDGVIRWLFSFPVNCQTADVGRNVCSGLSFGDEMTPPSRRQDLSTRNTVAWCWIYLGAFLMLAELMTPGFVIFFFGLASASVGVCCFAFGDAFNATWQLAAVSAFSILYLLTLRRLAKRIFCGSSETTAVDFCHDSVGRLGTVTVAIAPPQSGRVLIGDAEWTAEADGPIAVGTLVRVIVQQNLTMKVKEVK